MSKNEKPVPAKKQVTLQEVMNKTGLTRNQLINLFTDLDLSEIAFKNEALKNKAYKAQRSTFLSRKSALEESVGWKRLLLEDIELDKEINGINQYEKEVSKQMFEKIWPLIVPKVDKSGNDHVVIKHLEYQKPIVQQALGLVNPTTNKVKDAK